MAVLKLHPASPYELPQPMSMSEMPYKRLGIIEPGEGEHSGCVCQMLKAGFSVDDDYVQILGLNPGASFCPPSSRIKVRLLEAGDILIVEDDNYRTT